MFSARGTRPVPFTALLLFLVDLLVGGGVQAAEPAPPIVKLKEMRIETALVRDGEPTAAVVVPSRRRWWSRRTGVTTRWPARSSRT